MCIQMQTIFSGGVLGLRSPIGQFDAQYTGFTTELLFVFFSFPFLSFFLSLQSLDDRTDWQTDRPKISKIPDFTTRSNVVPGNPMISSDRVDACHTHIGRAYVRQSNWAEEVCSAISKSWRSILMPKPLWKKAHTRAGYDSTTRVDWGAFSVALVNLDGTTSRPRPLWVFCVVSSTMLVRSWHFSPRRLRRTRYISFIVSLQLYTHCAERHTASTRAAATLVVHFVGQGSRRST